MIISLTDLSSVTLIDYFFISLYSSWLCGLSFSELFFVEEGAGGHCCISFLLHP